MDECFENYAKVKVRPSSHQTYRGYIDNHIKPNIGKIPLEKLTSLELQKLYKKLLTSGRIDRVESKHQAKGLSPKTVRSIHQFIATDHTSGRTTDGLPERGKRHRRVCDVLWRVAHRPSTGSLLDLKGENIDSEKGKLRLKQQVARIDDKVAEAPSPRTASCTCSAWC